ncbi:hypothetical protein MASR2M8_25220 [Opitutaceae bacterium]
MSRRILQSLPFAALAAVLAVTGYWLMFTVYMVYDDEGYVLWSLRRYSESGGLYAEVFSQYGPFFYAYYDGLHRFLGFAFTHDSGRLITLGYWLAVAGGSGGLVWLLTRSRCAAGAAGAITFAGLFTLVNEPIHPGGLTTLIAMLGAAGGARALVRGGPAAFAAVTGLAGAVLALTKINVGLFFLTAAGSWLFLSTRPARATLWLVALGCVATPWLLMRALWPAPWVAHFALIFTCGALALVPALATAARPEHTARTWRWFIGSGGVLALAVLAGVAVRGTSLAELWDGMVVAPLRHPGVYFHPTPRPAGSALIALVSLALALVVQLRPFTPGVIRGIAALRVALGLSCLVFALRAEYDGLTRFAISFGPACVWLLAVPLSDSASLPEHRARIWLAWVFIWQVLHAYPVAGTQMAWGTFLWGTLLAAGLAEAIPMLFRESNRRRTVAFVALLVLGCLPAATVFRTARKYYFTSTALSLPGANSLRPPEEFRHDLEVVVENLRLHCDSLFSAPGMFSLNLWSGLPTPTGANVTHWFSLLSVTQQQAIIDGLKGDPRAGLVVNRSLLEALRESGFLVRGPLLDYLDEAFVRVLAVGTYELHLHRGRTIAPVSTARLAPATTTDASRVEIVIGPGVRGRIAAVALKFAPSPQHTLVQREPGPEGGWTLQRLADDGTPRADATPVLTPFAVEGITLLTLQPGAMDGWHDFADKYLALLDESGAEIGAARFIP